MTTRSPNDRRVYFLRITPANWIVAFWHSLKGEVYYWRSTLSGRLLSRFTRVAVESEITRDQWLLINDAAFDLWREKIYPALSTRYSLVTRYRGTSIDFSLVLIQHYSEEFERVFQLCRTLELIRGDGAKLIEPWFARVLPADTLSEIAGKCTIVRSALNRLLEAPYQWAFALGHLLRLAQIALKRVLSNPLAVETGVVLWTGISPQEMPTQAHCLDFAWPSRYVGVPASRIVYFLPVEPTSAQKRYFARDGRIALGPTEIARLVSVSAALRAFLSATVATVRALLVDDSPIASYRALFAARALLWVDIAERVKPSGYFTTTSYSWPERPEVAALTARGVPTTIWSYSSNALVFAHHTQFRDLAVWRTVFLTREFWVWNTAYRDWMSHRQVAPESHVTRFRVAGPLMCGDASWLDKDRRIAKRQLGLDPSCFYLAVFDVPLTGTGHRRTFYGGPRLYPDGYHEPFYRALVDLLHQYAQLRIFIKLKRPTTSQWHRFPKAQLELLDENNELTKAGRVVIVHQDTDPYLPIAACDAALGMLYTSPVLAAVTQGKPGAYFDPLGLAHHPSESTYKHMTVWTPKMLVDLVGQWLAGRNPIDPQSVERLLPIPEAGFDLRAALSGEQYGVPLSNERAMTAHRAAAG